MYVHISTRGSEGNHSKLLKSSQFFGGINTQFLKYLPSQFPKNKSPQLQCISWNWYQTLRLLSSILKKQNVTASPQVQRQRPTWRPSKRVVRPTSEEGRESPGLKHFFHGTTDALLVAGHAMPSQVMTSSCGTRQRDPSPIPNISTRCFPTVPFLRKWKNTKRPPVANCCYVWLVWKLVELQ